MNPEKAARKAAFFFWHDVIAGIVPLQ